jgi:hypothetical protein
MHKESDLQIIGEWVLTPSEQASENLASKSHETRRIPDPYIYFIKDHKLKTPKGLDIETAVLRGTTIYDAEYEALLKIQEWSDENDDGTSLWFSPPYLDGYSALKIVASEIISGVAHEKVLFNRAIVLDVDAATSLKIANYLSDRVYVDTEELRERPIFLKKNQDWMDLVGIYTTQIDQIRSSQDLVIKKLTLSEINRIYSSPKFQKMNVWEARNYAELEAQERGLIGNKVDSCAIRGVSAFNAFFGNSLAENPLGSFACPRCSGAIPSGLGITTCPHCGLTKEQAGSTCG